MAKEFLSNEQNFGACIIQDVLHLGRSEPPVHGHGYCIHHARPKEEREILAGTSVKKRNPFLLADSGLK